MRPNIFTNNLLNLGCKFIAGIEQETLFAESIVTKIDTGVCYNIFLRTRLFFHVIHPGETFIIVHISSTLPNLALIKRFALIHRVLMNVSFCGILLNDAISWNINS